MGVNIENIQNCTERNNKLYTTFSQQLVTNGPFVWHQHGQIHDTVIMSDYNSSTGTLSPLSYAHVTCITSVHGSSNYLLKCTYQIYNTIQTAGLSDNQAEDEESVLYESLTCKHCRFSKITCTIQGEHTQYCYLIWH